jgi:hypothetical protein
MLNKSEMAFAMVILSLVAVGLSALPGISYAVAWLGLALAVTGFVMIGSLLAEHLWRRARSRRS